RRRLRRAPRHRPPGARARFRALRRLPHPGAPHRPPGARGRALRRRRQAPAHAHLTEEAPPRPAHSIALSATVGATVIRATSRYRAMLIIALAAAGSSACER